MKKLWAARNEDGVLKIYERKPCRTQWLTFESSSDNVEVDPYALSDVTWEISS
jgi:hypothetical protein